MNDFANSQMLGEVQPGDRLETPLTLSNIQAALDAQKKQAVYWRVGQGLVAALGVYFLIRKSR